MASPAAITALPRGVIVELGRPLRSDMPRSRNQPSFVHAFTRVHREVVRDDGTSVATIYS